MTLEWDYHYQSCHDVAFVWLTCLSTPSILIFICFSTPTNKQSTAQHLKCIRTKRSRYWCRIKFFTKEHVNWLIPVFRAHWLSQFSHPGCFSKSHFTEAARKNCSICFYMRVVLLAGVGGRSVWTQPRILRGNCWRAIEAAPSDQAAVSMWHPAKTTGQQQNNTDQRWLPFIANSGSRAIWHLQCG